MLSIKGLTKAFVSEHSTNLALSGIDLKMARGEFITIVGSNGAGKSTLLNIIGGTIPATSGSILLENRDLLSLSEYERAHHVGRVFQNPTAGTAGNLTIAENMLMADLRGKRHGLRRGLTRSKINRYKESLARLGLGLENRMNVKTRFLSGGQRQALALVLATLTSPEILLLDEHTAALDPKIAETIFDLTTKLVEQHQLTVLMITHNIQHALRAGTRTVMMDRGEIVLDITGHERDQLTADQLIKRFSEVREQAFLDDRVLLSS